MFLRIPNGPQTQFNLDDFQPQPQHFFSKTVLKLDNHETVHERILSFFQNLLNSKIQISSFFDNIPFGKLQKSSSIQKLQILYQHPKFSSTTSISDRFSIKLPSEPSSQQLSYLTTSDLDLIVEEESFQSEQKLTLELTESLFDSKQQEFIVLSIGIMIKYLHLSQQDLKIQNLFYLLAVSTILGNKVYHDADMPMIIKQYSQSLEVQAKKLKNLERKVLKAMDYNCEVNKETSRRLRFYLFG